MFSRRSMLKAGLSTSLATTLLPAAFAAEVVTTRAIPSSGERVPVIGLGTSRTFDVGNDVPARDALLPVLRAFFDGGGRLIDSSPMYGSAEAVTGDLLQRLGNDATRALLATKVWTDGKTAGEAQMQQSAQQLGVATIDVMQIHNLRDWQTHLTTLRQWREQEKIRYLGITTSRAAQYGDFEAVMRAEKLDFVQLNYSVGEREAEKTLLPLAQDRKMAVLVNRPFMRAELFRRVRDRAVPGFAADYACDSWAQLFLKFAWSHPAVTCVIPATASLRHMKDNTTAGFGPAPDEAFRRQLLAAVA